MKSVKGVILKDFSDNFKNNTPVTVYLNDVIIQGVCTPFIYCENGFHDGKYIQPKYIKLLERINLTKQQLSWFRFNNEEG